MIYRKATFNDVEDIFELVNDYAQDGIMLARSRNTLYETLRDMYVAEENGEILGVGGLHIVWEELAEVRTLAVSKKALRRHIGANIVKHLLEEGKTLGVRRVFTLTYQDKFFASLGFEVATKDNLPQKVWKECIDCPKFPHCDEIAMEMYI
ncbi:GNAT family N-acetyltransferase [Megamonas hypermegale]|uniref:N-acetyltransferase n=1 Tax=Megamonas hypermegale TaxID=158847 RepID=UPI000B37527F|nr:N-acetyltransferase [Megamonas hypermegale]OUO38695.1 GNAT family N-acetyltransferase [Megamonas hypermegale]HJG08114.1 N-acetyltransferase [Megamonas hypermegale]